MNIVLTGASRGIGFELAKYFAAHGAKQLFVVSRDEKKLKRLEQSCKKINDKLKFHILPFSLEDETSIQKIAAAVSKTVSHVDVLVNNAGYLVNEKFEKISAAELQRVYTVNVFAPFMLTQSLLSLLGGSKHSHIVNIGSMGGVQGQAKFPGLSAYSSSKMALAGLSECLAEEFKGKNISVNCLALGAVNTEMLRSAFPGYNAPLQAAQMAEYIGDFSINGYKYFNGKILPVAVSTP